MRRRHFDLERSAGLIQHRNEINSLLQRHESKGSAAVLTQDVYGIFVTRPPSRAKEDAADDDFRVVPQSEFFKRSIKVQDPLVFVFHFPFLDQRLCRSRFRSEPTGVTPQQELGSEDGVLTVMTRYQ